MTLEEILPLLRDGAKASRTHKPFDKFVIRHGTLLQEVKLMALEIDKVYHTIATLDGYSVTADDWEVCE